MKNLLKTIGSGAKFVFSAIVFAFVLSLSYSFAQTIYPDNPANQLMVMALYDVAALIWFAVFMYAAKGTAQRALSISMFIISLAGVLLLVAAETISAETASIGGLDIQTLQGYATWSIVLLAGLNLFCGYLYYIISPANLAAMTETAELERQYKHDQDMREKEFEFKAQVQEETMSQMSGEVTMIASQAAKALAARQLEVFYAKIGVTRDANGNFLLANDNLTFPQAIHAMHADTAPLPTGVIDATTEPKTKDQPKDKPKDKPNHPATQPPTTQPPTIQTNANGKSPKANGESE